MTNYADFSSAKSKTDPEDIKKAATTNPFVFPFFMLGMAVFLGGFVVATGAEERITFLFGSSERTLSILKPLAGILLTVAHGHSMSMLGNARRKFQVPHPTLPDASNVAFWNANRGYYNMLEHIPFFLINLALAYEYTPVYCGVAACLWAAGRIIYTHDYAYQGPDARSRGFMISVLSSMSLLGVAILKSGLMPW